MNHLTTPFIEDTAPYGDYTYIYPTANNQEEHTIKERLPLAGRAYARDCVVVSVNKGAVCVFRSTDPSTDFKGEVLSQGECKHIPPGEYYYVIGLPERGRAIKITIGHEKDFLDLK